MKKNKRFLDLTIEIMAQRFVYLLIGYTFGLSLFLYYHRHWIVSSVLVLLLCAIYVVCATVESDQIIQDD